MYNNGKFGGAMVNDDMEEQTKIPPASEGGAGVSRRDIIKYFSLGSAGLLSANVLAGTGLLVREPGGPVRKGQLLSEAQMRLLRELAEVIIPETDTPGAAATDTHGFIDDQLANCEAPDKAGHFISQLEQLDDRVMQHWGKAFPALSSSEKHAAMSALAHHKKPFDTLSADFFSTLKSLVVVAYYSSKAGASQELVYLPIPGGYRGDFKLAENGGRAFSPPVF